MPQAAAEGTTLSVTVLDETEIRARGMGLLLGVAQGSAEPPRVIVIEHNPPGAPAASGARPGGQGHHV